MSPARVEFTVKELPAWYRHSFHLSGIATWFTNSGAINSPSDLGWREHSGGCSSLRNIETWVCCFLCRCDPAIENLRSFEHLHPSHTVRNGTTLQKLSKTTSKAEVIRRAKLEGKSSQEFCIGEEVPQVDLRSKVLQRHIWRRQIVLDVIFKITRLFWASKWCRERAHTSPEWKTHQNYIFRKKVVQRCGSDHWEQEDPQHWDLIDDLLYQRSAIFKSPPLAGL